MKLSESDKQLLAQLCQQHHISYDKILNLMETVREYEFKDRRTGIYDALKDIIKSDLNLNNQG